MTAQAALDLLSQGLWVTITLSAPLILGTLIIGLVVSIIQAATQINEATLTFAPKLIVVSFLLVLLGPWMIDQLLTFTRHIFALIVQLGTGV